MRLTIAGKFWRSLGLLILILIFAGVISYRQMRIVHKDVLQLVQVEEPLEEAILEMEINVGETAGAVFNYVWDLEPKDIEGAHDSEADFERYAAKFDKLAETDERKRLGQEVALFYAEFKKLGDEIITLAGQRQADLALFRKDVKEIDKLIDEDLQKSIDRAAPDAITKMEAALGMAINIDEALGTIEGYMLHRDPIHREEILDAEADFKRYLTMYRQTGLSTDEESWLGQIDKNFAVAVKTGNGMMAVTDKLREYLEHF